MNHRTTEAIHEAHQAVELANSAVRQLHQSANADFNERERLADELDRLLKQVNDLASGYPMTETERDAHGAAVIQLMSLHAQITGRAYGTDHRADPRH